MVTKITTKNFVLEKTKLQHVRTHLWPAAHVGIKLELGRSQLKLLLGLALFWTTIVHLGIIFEAWLRQSFF